MRFSSIAAALLLLAALPAGAYEVLLDVDLDGDPATINNLSAQTACTVRIVLSPTAPAETIASVEFGLGGSCLECEGVQHYGVGHDLHPAALGDWTERADFTGHWDAALHLGCLSSVGFHEYYWCEPVAGSFVLTEPIFLATFHAWVSAPPPSPCQRTPANLAAMPAQGRFWNYVQVGGAAIAAESATWGAVKGCYR